MRKLFFAIIIFFTLTPLSIFSMDYVYILNDKCKSDLYNEAQRHFAYSKILVLKDARGIILRYNFDKDFLLSSDEFLDICKKFELFLAKIENPAIIEVHLKDFSNKNFLKLRKWEISTIIANEIEAIITLPSGIIERQRINSIGYGEFLPSKNTPNNGGKDLNRIDIIILCNISGE